MFICVSDDYELGHRFAVKFAGTSFKLTDIRVKLSRFEND